MTEVRVPARAKSAHVMTTRKDVNGKVVPARDEVIPLAGMMSVGEAEKAITEVAERQGVDIENVRITHYESSYDAPMTTNPRRGHTRRLYGGWSPPADSEVSGMSAELLGWPRASRNDPDQGQEQ